jgi:hypothetical protein
MGVTFHALGIVGGCEGMNPHTPKWAPTLGVGVSMDSQIFKEQFQGSEFIRLKTSLYHSKDLKMQMSKMGLHDPIKYLKHKFLREKRPKIKVSI